jgi:hypothetical protein
VRPCKSCLLKRNASGGPSREPVYCRRLSRCAALDNTAEGVVINNLVDDRNQATSANALPGERICGKYQHGSASRFALLGC